MATHKSSEKRARQTPKRTLRNTQARKTAKTSEKKLVDAVTAKAKDIKTSLNDFMSQVMKAVSKGGLSKKTASRKISRLSKRASAATAATK
jgi:small subunit ribosomal protein S20